MNNEDLCKQIAFHLNELHENQSPEMKQMDPVILVKMTEKLFNFCQLAKFPLESDFFKRAFRNILIGKHKLYRLNIIELMAILRIEAIEYRDPTYRTPKVW